MGIRSKSKGSMRNWLACGRLRSSLLKAKQFHSVEWLASFLFVEGGDFRSKRVHAANSVVNHIQTRRR
jgi:hypothetical protein